MTGANMPTAQRPVEIVALADMAQDRIHDGPATIKRENGWLRNHVRLNVRDRAPDPVASGLIITSSTPR